MFKSIKGKFIFTILSLGIAILLLSGIVNQQITNKAITNDVKDKLEAGPKQIGRSIEALLYFRWSAIQLYSSFLSPVNIGEGLNNPEIMKNLFDLYTPYSWIGVITEEGTVLFSSDPRSIGTDFSYEHWFTATRDTLFTQVSDVHLSKLLYGKPSVYFTSPIIKPDGSFKGTVHSEIGLDYIAGGIKTFKMGKTGYLLLVRKDGKVIADSSDTMPPLKEDISSLQAFKLARKGKSGMIRERDARGVDSFISYQSLGGFMEFPGLGWSILAIQSREEVMASARRQTKAMAVIVLIGVAVFTLGGLFEARGIIGPITKIFNQVKELSAGDYSQPLEVTSNDELGKLAESFNNLSKSLQERESQLKSAHNYLDNLVSSSVDLIITTDVKGRITFLNPSAKDLLGLSLEEARGRPISDFYQDGLKDAQKVMDRLKTQGSYRNFETELILNDGRRIPVSISASLLKNEKGEVIGTLGVGKDLTETQELQSQLVHQEKMAGVGTLAAGIAHEIGNPLTSLSSLVQIMRRRVPEEKTAEKLDLMGEHIEKISKIVRELVDFSRPPSYQWKYSLVNDLIRSAVGLMKYDTRGQYVIVETNLADDLPMVRIIEDQLLQVFINIILNAFDSMEKGGKLSISSVCDNGNIRISFADTGEGIPKENMDKIFDPFFTTKDVGKGTGLGLSVSYGVMKNLGGDITALSELEHGATFIVSLPMDERNEDG